MPCSHDGLVIFFNKPVYMDTSRNIYQFMYIFTP